MTRSTRHALVAFLVAALACCTSWGRPGSWDSRILDTRPSRLRVTLTDGRRFDLLRPVARGDSLAGDTVAYRSGDNWRELPAVVPMDRVRSVSERRFSGERTALLAIGVTATLAVAAVVIADQISGSIMSGGFSGAGCTEMAPE